MHMRLKIKNPFKPTFDEEYALAKQRGDQRFGSPCPHAKVQNGRCVRCLRHVVSK